MPKRTGAQFTKHRKTNIRQCYDMRKVYNKCTIKRDLQKVVRQKLLQNVRHLISCRTTALSMHAVII